MFNFLRPLKLLAQPGRAIEVFRAALALRGWFHVSLVYSGVVPYKPMVLEFRCGLKIHTRQISDLITAWIIFFRREYTVRASDKVILDAGGNIGAFSLFAASRAPGSQVLAVEPFPATHERFLENLRANPERSNRIRCLPYALGAGKGTARMDATLGGSSDQSRGLINEKSTAPSIDVKTISLGELLRENSLETVDLLKMDIEGAEHELFAREPRETFQKISRISMEYHPVASKEALFSNVRKAGFELTRDMVFSEGTGVAEFHRVAP